MRRTLGWIGLGVAMGCGGKDKTPPEQPPTVEADADTDADADADTDADTDTDAEPGSYWQPGPHGFLETEVPFSQNGCETPGTRYDPDGGPPSDTLVVLFHGFGAKGSVMSAWGKQLATWGVSSITADLCHLTQDEDDAQQDALDMVARASAEPESRRFYVGHSSGGARAVLAADADTESIAVLGLDPTDPDGLGTEAQYGLAVPLLALFGEPHECNNLGDGTAMFQTTFATRIKVLEADHCDFQAPPNAVCLLACEEPNVVRLEEEVHNTVAGMGTAAVLWQAGIAPEAGQYWQVGGSVLDRLIDDGSIELLP